MPHFCLTDEVDVKTSFPLSRFVRDMTSFNVDFAVRGANSESMVSTAYFSVPWIKG